MPGRRSTASVAPSKPPLRVVASTEVTILTDTALRVAGSASLTRWMERRTDTA